MNDDRNPPSSFGSNIQQVLKCLREIEYSLGQITAHPIHHQLPKLFVKQLVVCGVLSEEEASHFPGWEMADLSGEAMRTSKYPCQSLTPRPSPAS